jgi:flagellar basal-body rod protein FlgB
VDFRSVLSESRTTTLRATHAKHLEVAELEDVNAGGIMYRNPFNASFDGNTVEMSVEQANYGKAAADYQATLNFLENRVSSVRKALRGD